MMIVRFYNNSCREGAVTFIFPIVYGCNFLKSNQILVLIVSVSYSDSDLSIDTFNVTFEYVVEKLGQNPSRMYGNTPNIRTYTHTGVYVRRIRLFLAYISQP